MLKWFSSSVLDASFHLKVYEIETPCLTRSKILFVLINTFNNRKSNNKYFKYFIMLRV